MRGECLGRIGIVGDIENDIEPLDLQMLLPTGEQKTVERLFG